MDYQTLAQTVTFDAGSGTADLSVDPINDADLEGIETLAVSITAQSGYRVAGGPARVQIDDDELTIKVRQVTFGGPSLIFVAVDPGDTPNPIDPPQWLDQNLNGSTADMGDRRQPVGYVRNTQVELAARFAVGPGVGTIDPTQLLVRGDGPGLLDVAPTAGGLDGDDIVLPLTAVGSLLADYVQHYANFAIDWSVSLDGGLTWQSVGRTGNQVYVTLDQPALEVVYHTVIYLATVNAVGADTPEKVIKGRGKTSRTGSERMRRVRSCIITRNGTLLTRQLRRYSRTRTARVWLGQPFSGSTVDA